MSQTFMLTRRGMLAGAVALAASSAVAAKLPRLPGRLGTVSPWLKRTDFLTRASGLSAGEFVARWQGAYAQALAAIPGLSHCTLNLVDHEHSPGVTYDAISELFFRDDLAAARWNAGKPARLHRTIAALEHGLVADGRMRFFTREVVIRDFGGPPPPGTIKRIGLVKRRPEFTHDSFTQDWRDVHAPDTNNSSVGLIHYALNPIVEALSPNAPWDGYAELWWRNRETYDAALAQRKADRAAQEKRGQMGSMLPSLLILVTPQAIR